MGISHLATSFDGAWVAAAEFEHRVHIWDVAATRQLASVDTVLDFGGVRLAISRDGQSCYAAAYQVEGIAGYSARSGAEMWRRKDLKKAQTIRVALDDRRLFCGFDHRSLHVLSCATGETIETWRGIARVWESPYEPLMLCESKSRELRITTVDHEPVVNIAGDELPVLCAVFGNGLICISEVGGPLRCFNTKTGEEVWRYARKDEHFLEIAYAESAESFVGICWNYENGGPHQLLKFDSASHHMDHVAQISEVCESAFFDRGSRLLSSDGVVRNSVTGEEVTKLSFPRPDFET